MIRYSFFNPVLGVIKKTFPILLEISLHIFTTCKLLAFCEGTAELNKYTDPHFKVLN